MVFNNRILAIIYAKIRAIVNDTSDSADSTFSSEKIDADYVSRSGDTMTGDLVTSRGLRQAVVWHAYGGFANQSETVACAADTWTHITNATNDLWACDEEEDISCSGDVLTITNAGDYLGSMSISISGLNGKDFHIRCYNVTQSKVMGRQMGISTTGAGNEMACPVPLYVEADAGDVIRFEVNSDDGTDPVFDDGIFFLTYLHD